MRVILWFAGVVSMCCTNNANPEAPYPPSGWRPKGPAFELPAKQENKPLHQEKYGAPEPDNNLSPDLEVLGKQASNPANDYGLSNGKAVFPSQGLPIKDSNNFNKVEDNTVQVQKSISKSQEFSNFGSSNPDFYSELYLLQQQQKQQAQQSRLKEQQAKQQPKQQHNQQPQQQRQQLQNQHLFIYQYQEPEPQDYQQFQQAAYQIPQQNYQQYQQPESQQNYQDLQQLKQKNYQIPEKQENNRVQQQQNFRQLQQQNYGLPQNQDYVRTQQQDLNYQEPQELNQQAYQQPQQYLLQQQYSQPFQLEQQQNNQENQQQDPQTDREYDQYQEHQLQDKQLINFGQKIQKQKFSRYGLPPQTNKLNGEVPLNGGSPTPEDDEDSTTTESSFRDGSTVAVSTAVADGRNRRFSARLRSRNTVPLFTISSRGDLVRIY